MQKHFKAIGISYKTTPLEVREAVSFDESQTKAFMSQLKDILSIEEALLISTCNRTELYYFASKDFSWELTRLIDAFHGTNDLATRYFVKMDHQEAVRHLFQVSLGLESMVLGDIQISNQIKKAYQWSADEGMAGTFLHRLLHTIFFTNKRSVQETSIHDGTASVASAAVDVATKFMANYENPKVVILGLGEIGMNVAENFKGSESPITLVNRTYEKAVDAAKDLGFEAASIDELPTLISEAHIVISAIQATKPLIDQTMIGEHKHPRLFIDLSVPRSIDQAIDQSSGVLLYNVDQLEEKSAQALAKRKSAVNEVNAIVSESISEFNNWSQEMEVSPTIKKFKQALEDIRKEELARYLGKVDEAQIKLLENATKNMIQKMIKLPVLQLKAACKRGEAEEMVGLLNDLFNLEKVETKSSK